MNDPIQRYAKPLAPVEGLHPPAGIEIRPYQGPDDQDRWIALHQRAFGVAAGWSRRHFMREFCQKTWWDSSRMWFACDSAGDCVGTICLGQKFAAAESAPVGTVLWLAVDPAHRRRGIARALVNHLESEALRHGYHRLELETLGEWEAANRLYQALGFTRLGTSPKDSG